MPSVDTAPAQDSAVVTKGKKVSEPAESAVPDARSAVADQSPVNDEAAADSSAEAVGDEVADTSAEEVAPVEEVVAEDNVATKSDDDEEPAEAIDPETMASLYAEFNALKRKRGQPRGPPSRPNQSSSDKRRKLDATGQTSTKPTSSSAKATSTSTQSKTPSSSTPKAGGSSQSTTKKSSNQNGNAKVAKKK